MYISSRCIYNYIYIIYIYIGIDQDGQLVLLLYSGVCDMD